MFPQSVETFFCAIRFSTPQGLIYVKSAMAFFDFGKIFQFLTFKTGFWQFSWFFCQFHTKTMMVSTPNLHITFMGCYLTKLDTQTENVAKRGPKGRKKLGNFDQFNLVAVAKLDVHICFQLKNGLTGFGTQIAMAIDDTSRFWLYIHVYFMICWTQKHICKLIRNTFLSVYM